MTLQQIIEHALDKVIVECEGDADIRRYSPCLRDCLEDNREWVTKVIVETMEKHK